MLWREDPQQSILFYNSHCCLTGWAALRLARVDESLRLACLPLIIQEMCKLCFGAERGVPGSRIVTGKQTGMRKGDKHGRWEIRREPVFGGEHNIELGVVYIIPSKLLPCQDYTNDPNTTALDDSAHFHRPHTLIHTHVLQIHLTQKQKLLLRSPSPFFQTQMYTITAHFPNNAY